MAARLMCRQHSLRAAAGAAASLLSSSFLFADSADAVRSVPPLPQSAITQPLSSRIADPVSLERKLIKSTRLLVSDALEGDCSLWRVLLQNEKPDMVERLLHHNAGNLKASLQNMSVFAGRSNPQLAEEIAYELGMPLGRIQCNNFADGETSVHVADNVRGKDVYVIQSTSQPVNESLLELVLIISAMRRASARSITAIVPYYGYKRDVGTVSTLTHFLQQEESNTAQVEAKRQEKDSGEDRSTDIIGMKPARQKVQVNGAADNTPTGMFSSILLGDAPVTQIGAQAGVEAQPSTVSTTGPGEHQADVGRVSHVPVSASDVARMLETAGVDRIISVELQPPGQGQIEGFFESRIPVESLRATSIGVEHITRLGLTRPVVVAPNEACIQLAHDFRSGLQFRTGSHVGFACIVEAGPSRGSDRYVHSVPDKRAPMERMELVGDVYGRDVVVVDDMLDTARTLMTRLQLLRDRGARRIVAYACHGLFNDGALQRITKSVLSDVIVTNTVPLREDVDVRHTHKIAQLSVAPLLAEAALRTQVGLSLIHLRRGQEEPEARYKGQE